MERSTEGSTHGLSLPRFVPLLKSRVAGAFVLPSTGKIRDRIKSYGRGRICLVSGCDTVLSAYNAAPYCSVHDRVGILGRRP
jgi:hypothetical protein